MKVNTNTVYDILLRMRQYFNGDNPMKNYAYEEPLRSELLSTDQMEERGRIVATAHRLAEGRAPDQLLKRLAENEKVLLIVRNLLVEAVKANRIITPAGEWLLDNFYLLEEQIVIGKKHLPKGYSQSLPRLANGPSEGLPRVYDIALEIISHSDGRVDLRTLSSFVAAYQTVTKLTLGELWAIPIMLRLALLENLRRVASRIALDKIDQNLADFWAEEMIAAAEKNPKNLILEIADMARSNPPMESPFVAEFTRRLQGKGPALALPLQWLEQELAETGQSAGDLVNFENQKQAANQVSMSNSIGSLRFLSSTNWQEFVETISLVDQALRQDIGGVYSQMDFATRDRYRHVVERIAKHSELSEYEVARIAIDLAAQSNGHPEVHSRKSHVGYYLVDKGLAETEAKAKMKRGIFGHTKVLLKRIPVGAYITSIVLLTLIISGALLEMAWRDSIPYWQLAIFGFFLITANSQFAVLVVNWVITLLAQPKLLPRMDYSKGIPPETRTLIVIPTIISDDESVDHLIEGLEVRYLANPDENLHFALLTDFSDAEEESLPGDDDLVAYACSRISELNKKYFRRRSEIFYLFHRPRKWNPREGCWMGYERKRGKLGDLNALLRGAERTAFSAIVGDYSFLTNVRYVITLDTDTQLPRETAWKLTATMAHPLNHPVYVRNKQRIVDGYGILQPRVAVSLPKANSSWYARLHANDSGLDPYTRVTSDVYQDLFREGSFIGKGIYDVDAFEQVLKARFPENRILSHDLLEGNYVRSGLLSDVQLYEEYPSGYLTDVNRRHRWIRGDWQIATWILPLVPGTSKRLMRNRLSGLSRWKISDNIRRSLVPLAFTALFILSWAWLSYSWLWTIIIISLIFLPVLLLIIWDVLHKPEDISFKAHIRECIQSGTGNISLALFTLSTLPFEAWYNLDAIFRTLWRMCITNKRLLQWTPSSDHSSQPTNSLAAMYLIMWSGPAIAFLTFIFFSYFSPTVVAVAAPLLILWGISPGIAWGVSLPVVPQVPDLNDKQKSFLRRLSRKTWAFFERFVGEEDNWLPPDNYQEHPVEIVAHRTSPTNMGISVLANLAAYDFGYIPMSQLLDRTSKSFGTMNRMEKYKGHFFNWYDTISLNPLPPKYISSVDSGNLCGHILTLRQGLLEIPGRSVVHPRLFEGIRDTFDILAEHSGKSEIAGLRKFRDEFDKAVLVQPGTLRSVKLSLYNLLTCTEALADSPGHGDEEYVWWLNSLLQHIENAIDDLLTIAPWLVLSEAPVEFETLKELDLPRTLSQVAELEDEWIPRIQSYNSIENTVAEKEWLLAATNYIKKASSVARDRLALVDTLTRNCETMADVEYNFLYDKSRHLLRIGYNVDDHRADGSYYDLLASESRLCTFVAIAQGKLPQESWFALNRLLTNTSGDPVLLSWSGSMFEYLMPLLVMPTYENTLLDQTHRATVERQIEYGGQRNIPWGMSESGYNMFDVNLNYQYRAFGVPGLGLKRGLGDDLVIAPYATMMALMVDPEEAQRNLQVLTDHKFQGRYGFFEAIDYTTSRLPRGQSHAIVRSFMVHHQGMGFLSLAYLLLDKPMQKRFEAEPQFQATLLLLQERIPRASIFYAHTSDIGETHIDIGYPEMRVISTPDTPIPEVQLMSNSKYQVMITNSGGGYSRWKEIAVTRWREDTTCDNWGVFCYIKNIETGNYWSNTYQPTHRQAKNFQAVFSQGHAEFKRHDEGFETRTEVVVSPEDDIEMRRVRITNRNQARKILEITSYTEVVLASPAADAAHPAFSNLFVQTEIVPNQPVIMCTRRPRSKTEQPPWMFHLMTVQDAEVQEVSYETDRMQFIGRGNTTNNPRVIKDSVALSGSDGPVLDPIVSIRYRLLLKPGQSAVVDMVIGIGDSREVCTGLMAKYQDRNLKNRAFEMSWTHSQVILRQINATEADAQLYNRIASSIIFANPILRADTAVIKSNFRGQSGLWSYSISGDIPIVLLHVHDSENISMVKQLVQAHAYWKLKGLAVDLVIWNEDYGTYRQALQEQILGLITASGGNFIADKPGGIFVRSAEQISHEDRILFKTVARVIIDDSKGPLTEQMVKRPSSKAIPAQLVASSDTRHVNSAFLKVPDDLLFRNGLGGFSPDGREYVIVTSVHQYTPAPWVNVMANEKFGTVISERGSAYTWGINAHEYRLTPWNNDPVGDTSGEAFYLRDEESGHFWSPLPWPAPGNTTYIARHGFGYSTFEHIENNIRSEMQVFVDGKESIKYFFLKVRNLGTGTRRLSLTGYMEWVLGELRHKSVMHVVTEADQETGALFATNRYNTVFAERVTFFVADDPSRNFTCDRSEFIGRNSTLRNPEAMRRTKLSGKTGAAIDPCGAIQINLELLAGQEKEIVFRLGTADNMHSAVHLVKSFAGVEKAAHALQMIKDFWDATLDSLQVQTPDPSTNVLANGWLTYQTLACRIWARSGYYQSGGAFGFRDQLQDVLSLLHSRPQLVRSQLLLHASRQFPQGDVQHWWHPPEGRGVRTRCSDDYLWLPYVLCRYLNTTGDKSILSERIGFIEGRLLNHDEESYYDMPHHSPLLETLYEHCKLSIRNGLRFGEHGIPLIGSGDWNDGMDHVGREGKGESVWLGFFLYYTLQEFEKVAVLNEDKDFAAECSKEAEKLRENIEANAWDGEWYRRAYFDDGTPLGTKQNEECRIDSISQSWSVISRAGDPERSRMAMESVSKYLVRKETGIIQLLEPPFDKSPLNPGYIKGYVPGVRENGGQYTHAAIWTLMANALLKNNERVWELFSMVNPINHGNSPETMRKYKVEPYVIAADIYARDPHSGRGGWTWYTGSAGWMYQFIIEYLLGITKDADRLSVQPCIPSAWESFKVKYRFGAATYNITYINNRNPDHNYIVRLNGEKQDEPIIPLVDTETVHEVVIE
ncbi:GH36-type glycosyl hydrolase domain-containing protein [Flavihumibacter solisilvae]|uniref:NdvB n=1 Tax=Flavihumibacter solisilvae TaxID=1349421 RepID=A0A0C1IPC3_9BACT|nr:glucoamylase family protein [Flavihumibacter solisilvae]KIC96035.1 NdvB [Flavihumibacter solisilvae]